MKHVCTSCGAMLPIDRDLDDDRTVEYVVRRHDRTECPHGFEPETAPTPSSQAQTRAAAAS